MHRLLERGRPRSACGRARFDAWRGQPPGLRGSSGTFPSLISSAKPTTSAPLSATTVVTPGAVSTRSAMSGSSEKPGRPLVGGSPGARPPGAPARRREIVGIGRSLAAGRGREQVLTRRARRPRTACACCALRTSAVARARGNVSASSTGTTAPPCVPTRDVHVGATDPTDARSRRRCAESRSLT